MKVNSAVNLRRVRLLLLPLLFALMLAGLPGLGTAHAAGVGPGKQAVVVGTGGGSVRYREGAGVGYAVKGSLVAGDKVWVLEGPVNGWYRISIGSTIGWVSGTYLAGASGSSAAAPSKPATTKPAASSGIAPNKQVVIQNAGGGNVRYREGAGLGYDVKGTVSEGDKVTVLEGPVDGWYRIKVGSTIGWISGTYLGAGGASTTTKPASTTTKPAAKSAPVLKGYAKIANSNGDAVRVRSTPGGKIIATAGPGTVLAVKQGPTVDKSGAAWYQVAGANITGWVTAGYLASSPAPKTVAKAPAAKTVAKATATPQAAARTGTARGATRPATTSRVGSGTPDVVSVAMQYVGYSYRFGGTSPSGFDCSGFVYYVFNKAGIPMGRSMDAELGSGPHISSSQLQPGDLVYFANTYRAGISHISIYIGNGKIVHAADYSTGVEISDLWSPYWAAHYAGAVRVSR